MIFYFSGTGNTRWAAIKLATATHERLIDIAEEMRLIKKSGAQYTEPFILEKGERLGFPRSWLEGSKTCQGIYS